MPKDKRLSIRISDIELKFIDDNLPPEVGSISELARTAMREKIEGKSSSGSIDIDYQRISELISESEQRILAKIEENQILILGNQGNIQANKNQVALNLQKAAIYQIINEWLSDVDSLVEIKTYDDLLKYVPYPHLKNYISQAITELKNRKYLIVEKSGRLRWYFRGDSSDE